jgi:hypothetical protein
LHLFGDETIEKAVDAVESVLYNKALAGDVVSMIFYLKAHRPKYRDKLNIDVNALDRDIEQRLRDLRERGFKIEFHGPGLISITEPPKLQLAAYGENNENGGDR